MMFDSMKYHFVEVWGRFLMIKINASDPNFAPCSSFYKSCFSVFQSQLELLGSLQKKLGQTSNCLNEDYRVFALISMHFIVVC